MTQLNQVLLPETYFIFYIMAGSLPSRCYLQGTLNCQRWGIVCLVLLVGIYCPLAAGLRNWTSV